MGIAAKTVSRKRKSPTATSDKKSARKSRLVYDFPADFLAQFFHMPQRQAAKLIGVAVITIKRNCKRNGIKWPYRANKYKAGKKPVLSERGRAFAQLPLDCMASCAKQDDAYKRFVTVKEDNCDTDTESVDDDDLLQKDFGEILFSLRKAPIGADLRKPEVVA